VLKAWADAVALEATAVMVAQLETDFSFLAPDTDGAQAWRRFFGRCRSAAAREVQVATGLPIGQCSRRVWLAACEPERAGGVRALMATGGVTLARAMSLVEATRDLDAVTAAGIHERVLAPLSGPDRQPLPGVAPVSEGTFRARLHRQLVLALGLVEQAQRDHAEAVRARRVSTQAQPCGTGLLVIGGDGPRIAAASQRIDQIARTLRRRGDARTLDQLRADVATDLLMRGWIPNDPTFTALGDPPAAHVQLLVSLPTLLGVDDGVGHLTGWGSIPAWQARQLALQLGSTWQRVVTDPLTGRAIEVSAGSYQVPAAMAAQIDVRDRTCRAPGCEIDAEHCDKDHTQEWLPDQAGGPTAETNLADLHRGHHNLKTAGFWDSDQRPDGTLSWTSATGRTYVTYPFIYEHPDNQPVKTSPLEASLGRRLASVINPDIPLPGRINLLDHLACAPTPTPTPTTAPTPITAPDPQLTLAGSHHQIFVAATTNDYPPPPF